MSNINGSNLLITGGAHGIGRLMGEIALRKGANKLVIWDIDESAMKTFQRESDYSDRIIPMRVDMSDRDQIISASNQLKAEDISINILINNAGIIVGKEFSDHQHDEIDRTMSINSTALMHTALCFVNEMIKGKKGHIVNIASAAGMVANPGMSVYVASKWSVIGWSESLRIELERSNSQVKVTTVTPSYISTGMFEGVKTHWISPVVSPEKAAWKIIRGIERDKLFVRMPWSVHLIPALKGLLPVRWFDFAVGKVLRVYSSMDGFKGKAK